MKIRKGFISNSSSSSFIFFIKDKSIVDEINKGIEEGSGWYNDTLAEKTTYFYNTHGEKLNIPKEILNDKELIAYCADFEQNNKERFDLLKDNRIIYKEFLGEC